MAGQTSPAQLQVEERRTWDEERFAGRLRIANALKDLVVVNTGIDDRGFVICATCGKAEPVFGRGYTTPELIDRSGQSKVHKHPVLKGVVCKGAISIPHFLGHSFRTDVLLLRVRLEKPMVCAPQGNVGDAARAALTSLVEALCLAATRGLQIDEGELAGNWSPVLGGDGSEADLFLYDVLPGGAGYTRDVRRNLYFVFEQAEALLAQCSGECAGSCYRCLRHYGNQILHPLLDRHLALTLVRHLRRGEFPTVDGKAAGEALQRLDDLLRLREVTYQRDVLSPLGDGVVAPMVVTVNGVANWVDVHHPLIDPDLARSAVVDAADAMGIPVVPVDTWTLSRKLPVAFDRVTGGG